MAAIVAILSPTQKENFILICQSILELSNMIKMAAIATILDVQQCWLSKSSTNEPNPQTKIQLNPSKSIQDGCQSGNAGHRKQPSSV
jgi:hypothetical protein